MGDCDMHSAFISNHPMCPFCHGAARPAILMFGDSDFIDNKPQVCRWNSWIGAVGCLADEHATEESDQPLRVAILEIGCGNNVNTVRDLSEKQLRQLRLRGADVRLI